MHLKFWLVIFISIFTLGLKAADSDSTATDRAMFSMY
jgi:hypothetical protein